MADLLRRTVALRDRARREALGRSHERGDHRGQLRALVLRAQDLHGRTVPARAKLALVNDEPLHGLTIGITAERRAEEQGELFRKRGAQVLHGATLRIFSAADDEDLKQATLDVIARPPDFLLASTGFGMRTWLSAAESWGINDDLLQALGGARVLNRGAKAASANIAFGLAEFWRAPDERFDEVVERVLAEPLTGSRVVMQLHASAQPQARARLRAAGAEVVEIDAYRSSLPDDLSPASALIDAACTSALAAVTFTTAPAVHNLFTIAAQQQRADELRNVFNESVIAACVGPVCAEGAVNEGITEPLVPERARLVPLVQVLTDRLAARP